MVDNVILTSKFALRLRMWPQFQTTVTDLLGGYEDRNQDWPKAYWMYECEMIGRSVTEIKAFILHVLGVAGAAYAFLLQDPLYYVLSDENIGTGDGSTTQFQISQLFNYSARPYRRNWYTVQNLVVKVNGVTKSSPGDYSESNGLITFTSAVTNGHAVTVSGDPYVRVRFSDDKLPVELTTGLWADAPANVPKFLLKEVPA